MSIRHGANITTDEDEVLYRAYINVSVNYVQGTNQTA